MVNIGTVDTMAGGVDVSSETGTVLVAGMRSKVPLVPNLETFDRKRGPMVKVIKPKFDDLLGEYQKSAAREVVTDMLSDTMALGCLAFNIEPVELILGAKDLGNAIAAADRKVIGPLDIKHLFIDPHQIMFRVQILAGHGVETSKNITDLIFVFMHEMTHLGQLIHAENEFNQSENFPYANRPTEIHADEVALDYCRRLLAATQANSVQNETSNILLRGLPETIKDAEAYRRPRM